MKSTDTSLQTIRENTDKLFAGLLWGLFAYSLALAGWYDTWAEAFVIGLPAALVPGVLITLNRGNVLNRIAVATAMMVFSGLTIHQAHGMIEMHFIIFALLAFLLSYRDWLPIVVAAAVIAVHHLSFNFLQESGAGVYVFSNRTGMGIVLIHAAFVVFESVVLVYLSLRSRKEAIEAQEMHAIAAHLISSDGSIDLTFRQENANSLVAKNFNDFMERIHAIIKSVCGATRHISSASEEMAQINNNTGKSLNHQQNVVEQVATAINEMTASVQEVARNTAAAAQNARDADEISNNGKQVVQDNVDGIHQLADKVQTVVSVVEKLETDSNNIGSVIDVIRGIAEQTNLLALNAAIEAARAGEQGRGFAVVADEVRTLASRTQQSTTEIQDMIERLQQGTQDAVHAMAEGQELTSLAVDRASKAGDSFAAIAQSISQIADMNSQIACAADEQSAVSEAINRNIVEINNMATSSADSFGLAAKAGAELAELGESLQQQIKQFKLQ